MFVLDGERARARVCVCRNGVAFPLCVCMRACVCECVCGYPWNVVSVWYWFFSLDPHSPQTGHWTQIVGGCPRYSDDCINDVVDVASPGVLPPNQSRRFYTPSERNAQRTICCALNNWDRVASWNDYGSLALECRSPSSKLNTTTRVWHDCGEQSGTSLLKSISIKPLARLMHADWPVAKIIHARGLYVCERTRTVRSS